MAKCAAHSKDTSKDKPQDVNKKYDLLKSNNYLSWQQLSYAILDVPTPSIASILKLDHTCALLAININIPNVSRSQRVTKELANLLQGLALGVGEEEEVDNDAQEVGRDENVVVPPRDILQRDGRDLGDDDGGHARSERPHGQAAGADEDGQQLGADDPHCRVEKDREEGGVEEDERDGGARGCLVGAV